MHKSERVIESEHLSDIETMKSLHEDYKPEYSSHGIVWKQSVEWLLRYFLWLKIAG